MASRTGLPVTTVRARRGRNRAASPKDSAVAFANTLHGGFEGFNVKNWAATPVRTPRSVGLKLTYTSKAGEGCTLSRPSTPPCTTGYPGTVPVTVTYTDDFGIDPGTINTNNISVTKNGGGAALTVASVSTANATGAVGLRELARLAPGGGDLPET